MSSGSREETEQREQINTFFCSCMMKTCFQTLLEYPLPQTWLLNPGTSDGDSLCVMAPSRIQLFAMQSLVPRSFFQLRRAQSLSIPCSVTGEEAGPQTHFHTILAQLTWDDNKTKAHATTYSDFFFLLLDGHVSATKPSPQLQRNCYLIVLFQHRQML